MKIHKVLPELGWIMIDGVKSSEASGGFGMIAEINTYAKDDMLMGTKINWDAKMAIYDIIREDPFRNLIYKALEYTQYPIVTMLLTSHGIVFGKKRYFIDHSHLDKMEYIENEMESLTSHEKIRAFNHSPDVLFPLRVTFPYKTFVKSED